MSDAGPPFIGREEQLAVLRAELEEVRITGQGRFVSVRGRRRIGKSTLVQRFVEREGVPHVFFVASRQSLDRELRLFTEELVAADIPAGELIRQGVTLDSWEAALTLVASTTPREEPLVLVLDEFPFLIEADPSIEAVLQKAWDLRLRHAPVLLVVIGSDLRMMEALTTYGHPLYGRPTRELVVPPLSPAEVADLTGLEPAAALDAYVVIGGFPQLSREWRSAPSVESFLRRQLGDPTSPFVVSGERAVTAEFPPQTHARDVLSAIGSGESSFRNIGAAAEKNETQLRRALESLEGKGAVQRLVPFAAKPATRATRYVVLDPYLRFWLRFIQPSMELLERGRGALVHERIMEGWGACVGKAIEPVVRSAIERLLPDEDRFGAARHVRGYWTRDSLVEVDLVGSREATRPKRADFIGSIKWRDRTPFQRRDFMALANVAPRVPGIDDRTRLVGVSRAGFEGGGLDVQLGPDDLVDAWRHR